MHFLQNILCWFSDADIVKVRNPLSKKHLKRLQDCAITSSTATEKKGDKGNLNFINVHL
jgi:hypothetical protein